MKEAFEIVTFLCFRDIEVQQEPKNQESLKKKNSLLKVNFLIELLLHKLNCTT